MYAAPRGSLAARKLAASTATCGREASGAVSRDVNSGFEGDGFLRMHDVRCPEQCATRHTRRAPF